MNISYIYKASKNLMKVLLAFSCPNLTTVSLRNKSQSCLPWSAASVGL